MISSNSPSLFRMRIFVSPNSLVLLLASPLPMSVNCHVFCRRSSFWIERVCSLTSPSRTRLRIVRLTLGGCCAHASAIPGRVTAAVTMKRSAKWSCCKRCNSTRSDTATFTFGNPSAMLVCRAIHVQAFPYSDLDCANINTTMPNKR